LVTAAFVLKTQMQSLHAHLTNVTSRAAIGSPLVIGVADHNPLRWCYTITGRSTLVQGRQLSVVAFHAEANSACLLAD
jgi:hypothetical protein